jgi:hypothetical protein
MKQIFSDGYSILSPEGGNQKHGSKMGAHMQLYGVPQAVRNSDVARPIYMACEVGMTVKALYAFSGIPEGRTNHVLFDEFRKAIAAKAHNSPIDEEAANTFIQNINNGKPAQVVSGAEYTGFYKDLVAGQNAIAASIIKTNAESPEAKLNFSKLNFNDPSAMAQYLHDVREYAQQIKFTDSPMIPDDPSAVLNSGDIATGATELKILLHLEDEKTYTEYITKFEDAIAKNFQKEVANMRQNVVNMGFTGNPKNNEALKTFAATRAPGEQAQIARLMEANKGTVDKVDRYILGRIHTGEIDINNVLATGTLNGVKLSQKSLAALQALNVYANVDAVTAAHHESILQQMGYEKKLKRLNLQNIDSMKERLTAFSDALGKAGLSSVNGKLLTNMSLEELRAIDLTKIDPKLREGLRTFISLKSHAAELYKLHELMQMAQRQAWSLFRKGLGNSDLKKGIGSVQTTGRLAYKAWMKLGAPLYKRLKATKLISFMSSAVKKGYVNSAKFIKKFVANGARKVWNATKTLVSKAAPGVVHMASETKKIARRVTKKIRRKHRGSQAKKARRELLKKAGRKAGKVRKKLSNVAKKISDSKVGKLAKKAAELLKKVAGKLLIYIAIILAIILLVSIFFQMMASVFMIVGNVATSIQETAIGSIIEFFADFFSDWSWPWEATEDEVQSGLLLSIRAVQDEERVLSSIGKSQGDEKSLLAKMNDSITVYHGCEFNSDKSVKAPVKINPTKNNTTFLFKQDGKYITQRSIVRKVISMANFVTDKIEYESELENFATYSIGLWRYMNSPRVSVELKLCNGGCRTLWYSCEDGAGGDLDNIWTDLFENDLRYKIADKNKNNPGTGYWDYNAEKDATGTVGSNPLVVLPSEMTRYGNDYLFTLYEADYHTLSEWDQGTEGYLFLMDGVFKYQGRYTIYSTNHEELEGGCVRTEYIHCHASNCSCRGIHKYIYNPLGNTIISNTPSNLVDNKDYCDLINQSCSGQHWLSTFASKGFGSQYIPYFDMVEDWEMHRTLSLDIVKDAAKLGNTASITSITLPSDWTGYKTQIREEDSLLWIQVDPSVAHGCTGEECDFDFYDLLDGGWDNWDYRGNMGAESNGFFDYCSTININKGLTKCHNTMPINVNFEKRAKDGKTTQHSVTINICLGHLDCASNESKNMEDKEYHYTECTTGKHALKYCPGHPIITVQTAARPMSEIYNTHWTYTAKEGVLFFKSNKTYSHNDLVDDTWKGWTDIKKSDSDYFAEDDWYGKYDIEMDEFIGGTCDVSEKRAILERCRVDTSLLADGCEKRLDKAFYAIGRIPYYPNESPNALPELQGRVAQIPYPLKSHTTPYKNQSNVMLGYYGLGYEYFAAYIESAATGKSLSETLSAIPNIGSWSGKKSLGPKTSPGAIIGRTQGNTIQTAIYVGCMETGFGSTIYYYITMSETGWCAFQSTSRPSDWVMWDSSQLLKSKPASSIPVTPPQNTTTPQPNPDGIRVVNGDLTTPAYVVLMVGALFLIMYLMIKRKNT